MKVYIVTRRYYPDFTIDAIFTTRKRAERYIAAARAYEMDQLARQAAAASGPCWQSERLAAMREFPDLWTAQSNAPVIEAWDANTLPKTWFKKGPA